MYPWHKVKPAEALASVEDAEDGFVNGLKARLIWTMGELYLTEPSSTEGRGFGQQDTNRPLHHQRLH